LGIISSNKNSLRTQLVHLKDPIPHTHKSTVVYHAPCAGNINDPCLATYIGETERSMDIQLREHHNKATLPLSDEYASAIGQHARTTDHHFRPEDITYLAREGNKMARGICALDPPSTGEVDCDISSRRHTTTSSRLPYAHRNHHCTVPQALQHPPSTSTALDPRGAHRDLTTVSCASHSLTPPSPSPWPRPPRSLRKPPFLPVTRRPGRPRKNTTTATAGTPLSPPRFRRHQPT
jgi:hypothetical protein